MIEKKLDTLVARPVQGRPQFGSRAALFAGFGTLLILMAIVSIDSLQTLEVFETQAIADMLALRKEFPKLDMPAGLVRQFATPPRSPKDCVFALTTRTLSADLKTKIVPCQFGGNPDCGSCGCVASMGLAAIAAYRLGSIIPVGAIFKASVRIGHIVHARSKQTAELQAVEEVPRVLPQKH